MNSAPTEVEEAAAVLKGIVGTAVVLAGYPEDDETDAEFGRRVIKHRERIRLILSDYARLQSNLALIGSACDKIRVNLAAEIHEGLAREGELNATIARLQSESANMTAALEPFALLAADEFSSGVNMGDPLSKWFTIAQLDNARAALARRASPDTRGEDKGRLRPQGASVPTERTDKPATPAEVGP